MKKLLSILIVLYFLVTNIACTKRDTSESPDTIKDSTNKTVAYIIKKGDMIVSLIRLHLPQMTK
jgi:hypothetical protein